MARPRQISKIQSPPRVKGFMPLGHYTQEPERIVMLHLEEYEAIRLLDYEHLSQEEASGFMQVSRPTLTRIYERRITSYNVCYTKLLRAGNDR